MKSLYTYIQKNIQNPRFDGHIHLFNHEETIVGKIPHELYYDMTLVGFMDIEFDNITKYDTLNIYSDFINSEYYNPTKHILLATGINIEEIKSVYNKYPNIIRGFGELKCYDKYKNKYIDYKNINFVREVVEFSSTVGNLPVYVHWEINNTKDSTELESVIKDFPNVPIVLCHFGMNDYNKEYAYRESYNLSIKYNNLWFDVSYTALDYFDSVPMNILNFPKDRIITGSDLNNKIYGKNHNFYVEYKNIVNKINNIYKYINTDNNLKKLFNF